MCEKIFSYGTLQNGAILESIPGSHFVTKSATLEGFEQVSLTLVEMRKNGSIGGHIIETDNLASVDGYEGVDRGLYHRVAVPLSRSDKSVWLYHAGNSRSETVRWVNEHSSVTLHDNKN